MMFDINRWWVVHFGIRELNGDQSSGDTKHLIKNRSFFLLFYVHLLLNSLKMPEHVWVDT